MTPRNRPRAWADALKNYDRKALNDAIDKVIQELIAAADAPRECNFRYQYGSAGANKTVAIGSLTVVY